MSESPSSCSACPVSRRDFVATGAASLAALALAACGADPTGVPGPPTTLPSGVTVDGSRIVVDLTATTQLSGGPGLLVITGRTPRPALLVRSGTGDAATYQAFDATCPHAGATNDWQADTAVVRCLRHGSEFARSTGAVTGGVANRGLTPLPTSRTGSTLTVDAG